MSGEQPWRLRAAGETLVARDGHIESQPADADTDRHQALSPVERLRLLCEEGSLNVIRSEATSERMGVGAYGRSSPAGTQPTSI